MLKLLSNLNNCIRFEVAAQAGEWPMISGTTGTFVGFDATGATVPTANSTAVAAIWTEGNRDGSAGFSPDQAANGKLTLLAGGYRCLTDQFVAGGTKPAIGEAVKVTAAGQLVKDGTGTVASIGMCVGHSTVANSVNGDITDVDCVEVVIY